MCRGSLVNRSTRGVDGDGGVISHEQVRPLPSITVTEPTTIVDFDGVAQETRRKEVNNGESDDANASALERVCE